MPDDRKQPIDGATAQDRPWESSGSGSGSGSGQSGQHDDHDKAEGTREAVSNLPGAETAHTEDDEAGGEPPCQGEFHG
jgi:hypothetical protein